MYKIYKNKIFKTKIGKLIKFVDKDSKFLKKFGEIYFNNIKISKKKTTGYCTKSINVSF